MGGAGSGVPGGGADFLRSGIHHPGPGGMESGARIQTVAAVLRLADGGRADRHAFPGAAASGRGRRIANAWRGSGPHHHLWRCAIDSDGAGGRHGLWHLDRAADAC